MRDALTNSEEWEELFTKAVEKPSLTELDKLRKKYLDPENMTHKALIYRMMCDSWTCYGQEFATIAIMRWACAYDRAITDYLRRLHDLKNEGVITNRKIKSKNGTEFAIWRVT